MDTVADRAVPQFQASNPNIKQAICWPNWTKRINLREMTPIRKCPCHLWILIQLWLRLQVSARVPQWQLKCKWSIQTSLLAQCSCLVKLMALMHTLRKFLTNWMRTWSNISQMKSIKMSRPSYLKRLTRMRRLEASSHCRTWKASLSSSMEDRWIHKYHCGTSYCKLSSSTSMTQTSHMW